jgi:hypothetical protein
MYNVVVLGSICSLNSLTKLWLLQARHRFIWQHDTPELMPPRDCWKLAVILMRRTVRDERHCMLLLLLMLLEFSRYVPRTAVATGAKFCRRASKDFVGRQISVVIEIYFNYVDVDS